MKVKIKKTNKDGVIRLETVGEIKEVLINEDFFHPEDETISICFRGEQSSGIIDLKSDECEKLYRTIRGRLHLIKGFKDLK